MASPYFEMLEDLIAALDLRHSEISIIETRHFFSGAALYRDGMICATWTPAGLALKLPESIREELLASGEGIELRYFENGPVKKGYVRLSDKVAGDEERLKRLLLQCFRHQRTHPRK